EMGKVTERPEVAAPACRREQVGEQFASHQLHAEWPGRCVTADVDRTAVVVAHQEDAGLLDQLAYRSDPERERWVIGGAGENSRGVVHAEAMSAREERRGRVRRIDLAAGERVEAAEEPHALLAANHVDLERLWRVGARGAEQDDGRRGAGLDRCRHLFLWRS